MSSHCLIIGIIVSLVAGQGPVGGEGDNRCCPLLNVTDDGFAGVYEYKKKEGNKPEPRCINGCIYKKVGVTPSANDEDEYCFEESTNGGFDTKCEVSFVFENYRCIKDSGKNFNNISIFQNTTNDSITI